MKSRMKNKLIKAEAVPDIEEILLFGRRILLLLAGLYIARRILL